MRAEPFIKWVGGKRQILKHLVSSLGKFENYHEPFLGGGALFFELYNKNMINKAYLYDYNSELINTYNTVRNDVFDLINELKKPIYKNEKEAFYKIRSLEVNDNIQRAARFIYLNRTAYNGLYRVNSHGKFNAPFGKYNHINLVDQGKLLSDSKALQKAKILSGDFSNVTKYAKKGDLIYFDPPYQPISKTSSFTSYTDKCFTENDQIRLSKIFRELDAKGCKVMLSNSNTKLINELYAGYEIEEVYANRAINSKGTGRGKISELIVRNWESKQIHLFRSQEQAIKYQ